MKRVGVVLSGCGVYDGTEINEAVLLFLELERQGAQWYALTPDRAAMHTVDHTTGEAVEEEAARQVRAEAARLTRGKVATFAEMPTSFLDGLVVPGGEGVVKNLMTGSFDLDRPAGALPEVEEYVVQLLEAGKPVGAVSLGEYLVSHILGRWKPEAPLPEKAYAALSAREAHVDPALRVVRTPGFLGTGRLPDVAEGVRQLVERLLALTEAA